MLHNFSRPRVKGVPRVALHNERHLCTTTQGLSNAEPRAHILEPQLQAPAHVHVIVHWRSDGSDLQFATVAGRTQRPLEGGQHLLVAGQAFDLEARKPGICDLNIWAVDRKIRSVVLAAKEAGHITAQHVKSSTHIQSPLAASRRLLNGGSLSVPGQVPSKASFTNDRAAVHGHEAAVHTDAKTHCKEGIKAATCMAAFGVLNVSRHGCEGSEKSKFF
mmetsp:Transcript_86519/g.106173  ORF Transcript_86519/g.106173 Transcript_86519/m.106173 type:complete len:218 (-) Transcript_86519:4-657(-)